MTALLNNGNKLLLILFVALVIFTGGVCALATIEDSVVEYSNVYGSVSYNYICTDPIAQTTNTTHSNMTHLTNEYVFIGGISANPAEAYTFEDVTLTPVDQRGSNVYMEDGVIKTGNTFSYGQDAQVGENPFVVNYTTIGNKLVTFNVFGWNGGNRINLSVNTNINVKGVILTVAQSEISYKSQVAISCKMPPSVTANVHWYATTTPNVDSSWSDTYITNPTSLNATFGSTAGVPSGVYYFKTIINGVIDTYKDEGLTNVTVGVYRIPSIATMEVTSCVDIATPINMACSFSVDSGISITSYKWQYRPVLGDDEWIDTTVNTASGSFGWLLNTQRIGAIHHDVGNYYVRVIANTSEGYSYHSDPREVAVIALHLVTTSESIAQGAQVTFDVTSENLIPSVDYGYTIQVSTNNMVTWKNLGFQEGILTRSSPNSTTTFVVNELGTCYFRVHAWNNGEFDYYDYDNESVVVIAPPKFMLTSSNVTEGESVTSTTLTLTHENDGDGLTWVWQKSTDNGASWSTFATGGLTQSVTTSTDQLTLWRVYGHNNMFSTDRASNVVGYLYHPNVAPITSASGIATSSSDAYEVPTKTLFPYKILNVYSLSDNIGLVVTEHAFYLIDATNLNTSKLSVTATHYVSVGKVKSSKYYRGHLMFETTDGRMEVQSLVGASAFGNSFEILGFSGAITDYDMSNYNFMVACEGQGAYTYDLNGDMLLIILDTESDNFAMTKATSDNNFEYTVIASNSDSNVLTAYPSSTQKVTVQLPNNVNEIYTITYDQPIVVAVTNDNTLLCKYDLKAVSTTENSFSWGSYNTLSMVLSYPSAVKDGTYYTGTNAKTLYVYKGTGDIAGQYPTSNVLTTTSIAGLSGNAIITGGSNGQVSLLKNSGTEWEGMQAISLQDAVVSLAMADTSYTFLSCTANYVFCAIQTQPEEDENVLTTTYYLKITVYNANGGAAAGSEVKVVSPDATNVYTTDSFGTVTIEVVPTKTYVISLPNGEDSITYIADNYALQYVNLKYPSVEADKLTSSATLRANTYIDINFACTNGKPYNIVIKVMDSSKNVLLRTPVNNVATYSMTYNVGTNKNFVVSIEADPAGDYSNHYARTYVIDVVQYSTGQNVSGTNHLVLDGAKIPLIPDGMDDNWKYFIFGALIMIIGALFSYRHAVIGNVLIAIIAVVMTGFGLIPLSVPWVMCMVFLAIMAAYSIVANLQGEG